MNYQKLFFKFSFLIFILSLSFLFNSPVLAAKPFTCICKDGSQQASTDCSDCATLCASHKLLDSCKGASSQTAASQTLPNPLNIVDLNQMIAKLINFVLSFVGSVSLLMFLYGGITWMTSAGSQDKVKKGRDIIIWAVIGLAVVFSSYVLVRLVIEGLS